MSLTWSQFKTEVKKLLTDVTASDELFTSACAAYVKARIAREVDHDLQLSRSYESDFRDLRRRLLGFTTTLSVGTTLDAAVKIMVPVDAQREGIQSYLTALIKQGYQELIGPSTVIEKLIREAVIDLQSHIECYRLGEETVFTDADVVSVGLISRGKMPEQSELVQGFLLEDIDALTEGTTYAIGDLVSSNGRTYQVQTDGTMGAVLTGLETTDGSLETLGGLSFVFYYGEACLRSNLIVQPWFDRYLWNRLRTGCESYDVPAMIAIDPESYSFFIWPQLTTGFSVSLFWQGLKFDFIDADAVPFDETAQHAAREYVLAKYFLQVENNIRLSELHAGAYNALRSRAYADCRARQRVRK